MSEENSNNGINWRSVASDVYMGLSIVVMGGAAVVLTVGAVQAVGSLFEGGDTSQVLEFMETGGDIL